MTKQEFLDDLRKSLSGLPSNDLEEHLAFYSEMIDDQMEDGLSEKNAVSSLGTVKDVSTRILADTSLTKLATERIKKQRRLAAWEIVLLILGAPIWLSLLVAAVAVVLSLYAVLWSLAISLWAIFLSFAASAVGLIISGGTFFHHGDALAGLALIGSTLLFAGLAILLFFAAIAATKGMILVTKKTVMGIKRWFAGRGKRNG